jgi:hypothetical protein
VRPANATVGDRGRTRKSWEGTMLPAVQRTASTNIFSPLTAGRTHVAMSIRGIARFDPPGDAQRSSNSNASDRSKRTDITMSELPVFLVFFFFP